MSELPEDPEAEQVAALRAAFLKLGFTNSEADRLAAAWADPKVVAWWLEQGCGYRAAVDIAT